MKKGYNLWMIFLVGLCLLVLDISYLRGTTDFLEEGLGYLFIYLFLGIIVLGMNVYYFYRLYIIFNDIEEDDIAEPSKSQRRKS